MDDQNIDSQKDNYFIFCLTDSFRSEYLWDKYGDFDNGVAIGLRFTDFTNYDKLDSYFLLKDVYYDSGYDFEFLNEIQYYLKKEIDIALLDIIHLFDFSILYKRYQFAQEKEIRLCFDYQLFKTRKDFYNSINEKLPDNIDLMKIFPIKKEEDRAFIEIPFDNIFFNISLTDIICGKNITETQFAELKDLKEEYTNIWYRK